MCADDATLFITQEIPKKFRKKIENYAYVTQTRNPGIHCEERYA